MIIIKTSNGDVLVNDQQMKMVEHDHANHVVRVTDTNGTMGLAMRHPYATIEHVEGIIYTNNAQPTEWKDEGSFVKSLQGIIDRQKYDIGFLNDMIKRLQSDLRHYSSNIIQIINYHTKEEMSDDIANRIRTEAETMKDKGNSNLWEYRHPYNKEHEGEEYTEGKVIQQQNEQIETLSRSVSEMKDEMETMRRRHAIHVTDIYARTLWQRILNKTVEP
jgi:hypothetical protein